MVKITSNKYLRLNIYRKPVHTPRWSFTNSQPDQQ